MRLLCFGNPHLKEDNLVISLAPDLEVAGFQVIRCRSPEEVMYYLDTDCAIVDVARGIAAPQTVTPDQLRHTTMVSLHDFDLNFFLKLADKLGTQVTILAIPWDYPRDQVVPAIKNLTAT